MFCRICGAQNNDNSNFCRECGSPLKAPAAAEAVENAAENVAEAVEETVQEAAPAVEDVVAEAASEVVQDAVETAENTAETVTAETEIKAEEVAAGAAAVAAVAAELVSQQNASAAEAVSPQPAQQYAPQQGQYQYAQQQGQYTQQPGQTQQQGYYSGNPQAVQPAQAVQAQPKQPKPPKKKAGAGRVILTIFLSLFLIIFFTVCIVEYSALKTINKDNIGDALNETDLSRMVLDSDGEELNLVEVIEDKADINISKEFDITSEQLEEIMDTPTVKKFISDNLADMAESVLSGEEPEGISKKTILDYVKKNKKTIYKDVKNLGGDFADITMEDIDNFGEKYGDQLDDVFDTLGTDKIDMDFIAEETGMDFDISRFVKLIPVLKWIAPGLAALFIILMLLGNIGYESLTGKGVSISAMIAGAITAGAAIAFKFILDIPDSNVLKVLGMPMADMMMIVGGIAFGAGLLLLIITCIIKAIANRARA